MLRMQNLQYERRLLCIANLSSSYSWAYSADMRARWRCPGKFITLCRLPKVITRYANAAEQRRRAGNPAAPRCKANTDLRNIKERAASTSRLVDPHPESCCGSYAADKSHCGARTQVETIKTDFYVLVVDKSERIQNKMAWKVDSALQKPRRWPLTTCCDTWRSSWH